MLSFKFPKFISDDLTIVNYLALVFFEEEVLAGVYSQDKKSKKLLTEKSSWLPFHGDYETLSRAVDDFLLDYEKKSSIRLTKSVLFFSGGFMSEDNTNLKSDFMSLVKKLGEDMELDIEGFLPMNELISSQYKASKPNFVICEVMDLANVMLVSYFLNDNKEFGFKVNFERNMGDTLEKSRNILLDEGITETALRDWMVFGSLFSNIESPNRESAQIEQWGKIYGIEVSTLNRGGLESHIYYGLRKLFFGEDRDFDGNISTRLENNLNTQKDDEMSNYFPKITNKNDYHPSEGNNQYVNIINSTQSEGEYPVQSIRKNSADSRGASFYNGDNSSTSAKSLGILASIKKVLKVFKMKKSSVYSSNNPLKMDLSLPNVLGSVLIFLVVVIAINFFYSKAKVVLLYRNDKTSTLIDLTLGKGLLEEEKTNTVPIAQDATGKKLIGDKATGNISISNLDRNSKLLKKGSTLRSSGKSYVLESDVSISSASANLTSDGNLLTIASKASAKINATTIGEEYNLVKGAKFTFDGFGENLLYATGEAIEGGSSKEVNFISKGDLDKAKSNLVDKILTETNANSQIKNKLVRMRIDFDDESIPEVGKEVTTVKFDAKAKVIYLLVDDAYVKKSQNLTDTPSYIISSISTSPEMLVKITIMNKAKINLSQEDIAKMKGTDIKKLVENSKQLSKVPYGIRVEWTRAINFLKPFGIWNNKNIKVDYEIR